MSRSHDVVVVGGGAIGAACARELARTGRRVLVLERGGASGQAWKAAAGMLAPQIEASGDDPLFRLGLAGRDHYTTLAPALHEATGIDIGLWQDGIVHVARDAAEAGALERRAEWLRAAGQEVEWLGEREARARWPWLGTTAGALRAARDGAVDPPKLVDALLADAQAHGASTVEETVVRIDVRNGRVQAVVGERDTYAADAVVLAAGAWSAGIVNRTDGLRRRLPVEPVRGQMAALPWPATVPRAIVYGHGYYLLYRGGEAVAGSTMERVGFQSEPTPQGIAAIVAGARALCPALAGGPLRSWAGLRPITPDGAPVIGPDPDARGLWYATGHGRNGILLAGITGTLVAQLLGGSSSTRLAGQPIDLGTFSPARF